MIPKAEPAVSSLSCFSCLPCVHACTQAFHLPIPDSTRLWSILRHDSQRLLAEARRMSLWFALTMMRVCYAGQSSVAQLPSAYLINCFLWNLLALHSDNLYQDLPVHFTFLDHEQSLSLQQNLQYQVKLKKAVKLSFCHEPPLFTFCISSLLCMFLDCGFKGKLLGGCNMHHAVSLLHDSWLVYGLHFFFYLTQGWLPAFQNNIQTINS